MTEPRVETRPDQDPYRLGRVRDLRTAVECAAVGHAAAIYHAKARVLMAATPPRDGYGVRVKRFVVPRCPDCGGAGIQYHEREERRPVPQAMTVTMDATTISFAMPEIRTEPTIVIRECACVRYEVAYVRAEPAEQLRVGKTGLAEPASDARGGA